MAEAPWEHPASFTWPLPLYTSACPTRNGKLMADTRASCGRRFPGAADGFIARSQKEMPGWYQSTNNLSNAKGPLTESSRVEGYSRTHLGRCLGLESRQGGGTLTQCSKPAPPSPADRNTAKDPDTPLLTAGAQTSFYIPHAWRGNQPGGEFQIQEKNCKLVQKGVLIKNAANDSTKCKFGAALLMAIWQYVWKV